MSNLIVILGSNSGEREKYLQFAINNIQKEVGEILRFSSIYESESWGYSSKNLYLNQVIELQAYKDAESLLHIFQNIEKKAGRIRNNEEYSDRTLDIDILFYGNLIIHSENLIIPHSKIPLRQFVLQPLCELMPDFIHPELHRSMQELLLECKDRSEVRKR
jgi:2-amino-4-hydroxy-6-hydroxymethyldihydropteridine diphosphokinase